MIVFEIFCVWYIDIIKVIVGGLKGGRDDVGWSSSVRVGVMFWDIY